MTTNAHLFMTRLAAEYRELFLSDPDYAFAASRTTPDALAEKMTTGLITGSANKDGAGIKRVAKSFGLPHTYKAIRAFLTEAA